MGRDRDGSFRLTLGVLVAMQAPPCQAWADASVLAPGGSNEATVAALELGDYDNVTSRATRESSAIKLDLPWPVWYILLSFVRMGVGDAKSVVLE